MVEEVIFESEQTLERGTIADYLRRVAASLDGGDPIVLRAGEKEVVLEPPSRLTFEVKAEREGGPDTPSEYELEFELEWSEETKSAPLEIE